METNQDLDFYEGFDKTGSAEYRKLQSERGRINDQRLQLMSERLDLLSPGAVDPSEVPNLVMPDPEFPEGPMVYGTYYPQSGNKGNKGDTYNWSGDYEWTGKYVTPEFLNKVLEK